MFDFSKYNLGELQAMSDLLDYLREDAGADALSYFCGCSMLQAIKHESLRLSRSILMSLEWQAAAQAEAEKVDRIKQACIAGAPPAVKCCNIDRCGVCLTDCPYTDDPLPSGADEPAPDMFGWVNDALDGLQV